MRSILKMMVSSNLSFKKSELMKNQFASKYKDVKYLKIIEFLKKIFLFMFLLYISTLYLTTRTTFIIRSTFICT